MILYLIIGMLLIRGGKIKMTNPELIDHLQSEIQYCASRAILATSHASRNYWIGKQHGYENVIELLITKQTKEETINE